MKNKIIFKTIALAAILAAIPMTTCSCGFDTIRPGYVGVIYSLHNGTKAEVLSQGMHWTPLWHIVCQYSTTIEQSYLTAGENGDSKKDESFSACTSEGKDVIIDLTFTYQFDEEHITEIFTMFKAQDGETVRDNFIKPNIVSWTKEYIAKYSITDIIGAERENINEGLSEHLAAKFAPYYINISNASLINVEVDEQTSQAINNKIQAQQSAETQAIENQKTIDKAQADAEAKKTAAQAEADAELIEAQAEADATRIRAEAEAEANKLLAESLTSEVLDSEWIAQWNGQLPTIMDSESDVILSDYFTSEENN